MEITAVAHVHTGFSSKFGVPRQSGLAPYTRGTVEFVPAWQNPQCVYGLEGFSHLWLIWQFTASVAAGSSLMVRPPRLGGNRRIGVFASRSPFRPNHLGLSSVVLDHIEYTKNKGPVLHILGADLLDGTPVFDIKPYVPTDCHSDACAGFASEPMPLLRVADEQQLLTSLPDEIRVSVKDLVALDPRPAYHEDGRRMYALEYGGFLVRFFVAGGTAHIVEVNSKLRD